LAQVIGILGRLGGGRLRGRRSEIRVGDGKRGERVFRGEELIRV